MRGVKRKVKEEGLQHIYQNTYDGKLLFYSVLDRLVFLTIYSVVAKKYGVPVLGLCLMFDHIHSLAQVYSTKLMSLFVGEYTSKYVIAFNRNSGRKGPVFRKAYGNAPKIGLKKIRTTIAYLYNNHVEKKLCNRAEESRWNFLAYVNSDHPFSEKIDKRRCSNRLKKALARVNALYNRQVWLDYPILNSLYDKLSETESEQLTDYIISKYLPLDKESLIAFYGDYETMLIAINSNTGSEYDLKENYDSDSDEIYESMLKVCKRSIYAANIPALLALPIGQKLAIADILMRETGAKPYQVRKFLHLAKEPHSRTN